MEGGNRAERAPSAAKVSRAHVELENNVNATVRQHGSQDPSECVPTCDVPSLAGTQRLDMCPSCRRAVLLRACCCSEHVLVCGWGPTAMCDTARRQSAMNVRLNHGVLAPSDSMLFCGHPQGTSVCTVTMHSRHIYFINSNALHRVPHHSMVTELAFGHRGFML